MFKSYFSIALRNLLKYRTYAFINIAGLSIGIACCILLFLFVRSELSYDTFHSQKDQIYRIYSSRTRDSGEVRKGPYLPMPFAPVLRSEYPEVEAAVRFRSGPAVVRAGGHLVRQEVLFTDPEFFTTFSFDLKSGDPGSVFSSRNAIVITEVMAEKYFPGQNAVGQTITIGLGEGELDFLVTGIINSAPQNSSIKYDMLVPFARLADLSTGARERAVSWNSHNTLVYIKLAPQVGGSEFEAKLPAFAGRHFDPPRELYLQRMTDVHLDPEIGGGNLEPASDPKYSFILGGIAVIVLAIACINFMTLAVGQSTSRTREVGLRKVMGAARAQIIKQFWGEALVMSGVALVLGLVLAALFLPTFNNLVEMQLRFSDLVNINVLFLLVLLVAVVGVAAGSYPAVLMARFKPISIFRDKVKLGGTTRFGRFMVVLQFSLSIFLMITTIVMGQQKRFLLSKNLGYQQDKVLVIPTIRSDDGEKILKVFKDNLANESSIAQVSGTGFSFDRGYHHVGFEIQGEPMSAFEYRVDYNYLSLLGIELMAGRDFSAQHPSDPEQAAIINQAFAEKMGWQEPLGQSFRFRGKMRTVIGLVRDYHFQSLHTTIQPVVLHLDPEVPIRYVLVRLQDGDLAGGVDLLRSNWQAVAGELPFEYYFLDGDIARQYRNEERWDRIVTYSSVLAILIACLGLLGLSSLSAARRKKELGIRKVLGASVPRLIGLINREHLLLVLIGNVIAWPMAYFVIDLWLQNFAYRIQLGLASFCLAALAAMAIAFVTVSYQALRGASANPVETLRYE